MLLRYHLVQAAIDSSSQPSFVTGVILTFMKMKCNFVPQYNTCIGY